MKKNDKDKPDDIQPGVNFKQNLNWVFTIDGCETDIRKAPREFQEQAYNSGMIPFIPADYSRQGKKQEEFENNIRIVEIQSEHSKKTESETVSE